MVINFRTAVVKTDGKILFRQQDIAMQYGKTWLAVDITSCLPFGYIEYIGNADDAGEHRALKLLRLIRLLRLARIMRIFERWEEMLYGARWFKMVKVAFTLVGCAHWLACMWYYCGQGTLTPGTAETLAGAYQSNGWVVTKYRDWTNFTAVTLYDRYFDSFFWGMSTSLMVSSSDDPMSPTTKAEKIAFLFSFFVGALVFSVIIGTVSDLIAHSSPGATARNDAIGMVNAFLSERGVKPSVLRRARSHVKTLLDERGTHYDIANILDMLPYDVQVELGAQLRFIDDPLTSRRSVFARVPFFQELCNDAMLAVGCKLKHVRYAPPERSPEVLSRSAYIMHEGDRGVEMWIVVDGVVGIETGSGADTVDLGKLREGDYFGELAVICHERPGVPLRRRRSAFAFSDVMLLSLSYGDMCLLRQAHPQIDAAVREASVKLRESQPDVSTIVTERGTTSNADVVEMRQEIAELRDSMAAGFDSLRAQIAALPN